MNTTLIEMDYEDFNDTETPNTTSAIKDQLEAQGREIGIELDKRNTKTTLISELETFIASK